MIRYDQIKHLVTVHNLEPPGDRESEKQVRSQKPGEEKKKTYLETENQSLLAWHTSMRENLHRKSV